MKIIGITTESENIAKMLGIKNNHEYGLCQETEMGSYYAKFLPDGSFEEKVVCLVSDEHEPSLSTIFKNAEYKLQKLVSTAPAIDMANFNKKLTAISNNSNELAKQMGKDVQRSLKCAGFNPTLRKDLLCSIG